MYDFWLQTPKPKILIQTGWKMAKMTIYITQKCQQLSNLVKWSNDLSKLLVAQWALLRFVLILLTSFELYSCKCTECHKIDKWFLHWFIRGKMLISSQKLSKMVKSKMALVIKNQEDNFKLSFQVSSNSGVDFIGEWILGQQLPLPS